MFVLISKSLQYYKIVGCSDNVFFFFDVAILSQEKELSIPHEELGRSIATVQVLQRKHEAFERELTALGNKVVMFKEC